jgi:hypothetical protein
MVVLVPDFLENLALSIFKENNNTADAHAEEETLTFSRTAK